jgi:heparanase 1
MQPISARLAASAEYKQAVHTLPERFISAAIDSSLIIGGYWWEGGTGTRRGLGTERAEPLNLGDRRLIEYSRHLGLGYLRIGGTEADRFYYRISKKDKKQLSRGYGYDLSRRRWDEIIAFTEEIGARLCMTLNAGPGARKKDSTWRRKNARRLIRYSRKHQQQEAVWELGNEVNAYIFFHGLGSYISSRQYAADISRLSKVLTREKTGRLAGPAAIVWPVLGETLPFIRSFLRHLEAPLDILTWHYYPQQSSRCPVAVRRARPETLLSHRRLDDLGRQARRIRGLVEKHAPGTELWLGETGHALCGGEPGISDRFVSSLWWLDALGQLARGGHHQVVRQALIGGDYGLLRSDGGPPNPDYWATLLWNGFMGWQVYTTEFSGSKNIRAYLHSAPDRAENRTLLLINLDPRREAEVEFANSLPPARSRAVVTSTADWSGPEILSRTVHLNERPLRFTTPTRLPDLSPEKIDPARSLSLPPLSYGFFTLG